MQSSHQIIVTTTDDGNPPLSFSKNLTVFLRNVNDKPRDIRLSNGTVAETAPVNFIFGKFTASDEDSGIFLVFLYFSNDQLIQIEIMQLLSLYEHE